MSLLIRKATPEDFEQVHQLILAFATFIKTPEKVSITADQMVKDQDIFNCIVAVSNLEIVGFATYFFPYHSWSGKAIYLDDLYVKEDYRDQNIGNSLFDKVKEIGKTTNCVKMKWQVSSWNKKAIAFYKSKGANIDDTEINCDLTL